MLKKRKRRSDRNQAIYLIQDKVTGDSYIGLTALSFGGSVKRTLNRRLQKHFQRARTESKNWGLSVVLRQREVSQVQIVHLVTVRGKKEAHVLETTLIQKIQPKLNTFGVKKVSKKA
jgi:hypothetical protein